MSPLRPAARCRRHADPPVLFLHARFSARAGLAARSVVIEEPSYIAMPRLLAGIHAGTAEPFDAVLVDGMHLFDFTLVDLFFAALLLRRGGALLLDDIRHEGVRPAYDYIQRNYGNLRLVEDTGCAETLATFVKVGDDTRSWDFHVPFTGGGEGGGVPRRRY